jgi:hypothetical protein
VSRASQSACVFATAFKGRQNGGMSSTTVPLTLQLLKPTMPLHDLSRRLRRRRKPGEEVHQGDVYCFGTGSSCELLDIGVNRYRVLPGFLYLGGTQCHVSSPRYS